MTLWITALALFTASGLMGGLNYVTTILTMRTKGIVDDAPAADAVVSADHRDSWSAGVSGASGRSDSSAL